VSLWTVTQAKKCMVQNLSRNFEAYEEALLITCNGSMKHLCLWRALCPVSKLSLPFFFISLICTSSWIYHHQFMTCQYHSHRLFPRRRHAQRPFYPQIPNNPHSWKIYWVLRSFNFSPISVAPPPTGATFGLGAFSTLPFAF
jgi:hypothetical protein